MYIAFVKGLTRRVILSQYTAKENDELMKLLDQLGLSYDLVMNKFDDVEPDKRASFQRQIPRETRSLRMTGPYLVSAKSPRMFRDWLTLTDSLTIEPFRLIPFHSPSRIPCLRRAEKRCFSTEPYDPQSNLRSEANELVSSRIGPWTDDEEIGSSAVHMADDVVAKSGGLCWSIVILSGSACVWSMFMFLSYLARLFVFPPRTQRPTETERHSSRKWPHFTADEETVPGVPIWFRSFTCQVVEGIELIKSLNGFALSPLSPKVLTVLLDFRSVAAGRQKSQVTEFRSEILPIYRPDDP